MKIDSVEAIPIGSSLELDCANRDPGSTGDATPLRAHQQRSSGRVEL
jgi:hypothetical protein